MRGAIVRGHPPGDAWAQTFDSLPNRGEETRELELEARGGIEPPLKVLQTFALPLGDRASRPTARYHSIARGWVRQDFLAPMPSIASETRFARHGRFL